jgi:hypothetical protein
VSATIAAMAVWAGTAVCGRIETMGRFAIEPTIAGMTAGKIEATNGTRTIVHAGRVVA